MTITPEEKILYDALQKIKSVCDFYDIHPFNAERQMYEFRRITHEAIDQFLWQKGGESMTKKTVKDLIVEDLQKAISIIYARRREWVSYKASSPHRKVDFTEVNEGVKRLGDAIGYIKSFIDLTTGADEVDGLLPGYEAVEVTNHEGRLVACGQQIHMTTSLIGWSGRYGYKNGDTVIWSSSPRLYRHKDSYQHSFDYSVRPEIDEVLAPDYVEMEKV